MRDLKSGGGAPAATRIPQRARGPPPDHSARARPGPADAGLRPGLVLLATGPPSRRPGLPLGPAAHPRAAATVGVGPQRGAPVGVAEPVAQPLDVVVEPLFPPRHRRPRHASSPHGA